MDQRPRWAGMEGGDGVAALLRTLLLHSGRLLGAAAGSVSLVDATGDRYSKLAEHGASCQLGRSFPLDEGVTGQVVERRRPVVLESYDDVPTGHLSDGHVARHGAVVAVPIWWRGDVFGANVVFAGRRRTFSTADVDELELLTQVAVPGLVRAGTGNPWLSHLLRGPVAGERQLAAGRVGRPLTATSSPPGPGSPLTPREQETLDLLARGLSNQQVAAALVLSLKTVEKHVASVLRKTGASSRTGAVVSALQRGWLSGRGAPVER